MDLIAIHLGRNRTRLCRWDGRSATARVTAACHPRDAWPAWIESLGASTPHEVVFHCANDEFAGVCPSEIVREWASRAGARWVRWIGPEAAADPGLAAARHLANHTRWTTLVSIERDDDLVRIGLQDRRGRVSSLSQWRIPEESPANSPTIMTALSEIWQAPGADGERGLFCLGDDAERWGPLVAARLGCERWLAPPNADTWPLLGLMIAPIHLHFRAEAGARVMPLAALREAFLPLMDLACDAITREGYDLDDAECTRLVELIEEDNRPGANVTFDALAAASATAGQTTVDNIHRLRLTAIIAPPTPDWRFDVAPPLLPL